MELLDEGAITALVIGLTQFAKGHIEKKYVPLLSLILGILLNVLYTLSQGRDIISGVLYGAVIGLTASGLYDVQNKKVLK